MKPIIAVLALGGALILPVAVSAKPATAAATHAMADKGAVLPLKASFEKNPSAKTDGPYVLTLTNTSDKAVTASAKIDEDVTAHNRPKVRHVGPQEIAPGKEWKIDDLAALDKVTVSADGFEDLKLTVGGGK